MLFRSCSKTNAQKILSHYVCDSYGAAEKEIVQARCDVINKFGNAGLSAVVTTEPNEDS